MRARERGGQEQGRRKLGEGRGAKRSAREAKAKNLRELECQKFHQEFLM